MYNVIVWNDLQEDFIPLREDGKIKYFANEVDAMDVALTLIGRNIQAKVEYVRRQFIDKNKKKRPRAGRIKRIQTTMFCGERVRIVGVIGK
jgi:hypothetical protein